MEKYINIGVNDMSTIIPKDYKSSLNVIDTQIAIKN